MIICRVQIVDKINFSGTSNGPLAFEGKGAQYFLTVEYLNSENKWQTAADKLDLIKQIRSENIDSRNHEKEENFDDQYNGKSSSCSK